MLLVELCTHWLAWCRPAFSPNFRLQHAFQNGSTSSGPATLSLQGPSAAASAPCVPAADTDSMVKRKDKKKGGSLHDVFGKDNIEPDAGGGWQTGSAAMLLDDELQPEEMDMVPVDDANTGKKKKNKSKQGEQSMDCSDEPKPAGKAVTKIPGLGVVTHSMKRGDRTTKQKKRKAAKLVKAVARAEKAGVRIDTKQHKKQKRGELKHLY